MTGGGVAGGGMATGAGVAVAPGGGVLGGRVITGTGLSVVPGGGVNLVVSDPLLLAEGELFDLFAEGGLLTPLAEGPKVSLKELLIEGPAL
jgi:hypothetical protein